VRSNTRPAMSWSVLRCARWTDYHPGVVFDRMGTRHTSSMSCMRKRSRLGVNTETEAELWQLPWSLYSEVKHTPSARAHTGVGQRSACCAPSRDAEI
jgi:hypothetical protein